MCGRFGNCLWLIALFALGLVSGCATPPSEGDAEALAEYRAANDPLEPTNRFVYVLNDGLDTVIFRPVARAYGTAVPAPARRGIRNALSNLRSPVRLMNDMLQGKPRRAGDTTMRFVINSTAGVLGIFDVAADLGYPYHDADFGVTLANWGVPEGPYLFLPVLGPSGARDTMGLATDVAADPFIWVGQGGAVLALNSSRVVVRAIDERERLDPDIERVKTTALDPYAVFRSVYRQQRRARLQEVRDDNRATVPVWFARPTD